MNEDRGREKKRKDIEASRTANRSHYKIVNPRVSIRITRQRIRERRPDGSYGSITPCAPTFFYSHRNGCGDSLQGRSNIKMRKYSSNRDDRLWPQLKLISFFASTLFRSRGWSRFIDEKGWFVKRRNRFSKYSFALSLVHTSLCKLHWSRDFENRNHKKPATHYHRSTRCNLFFFLFFFWLLLKQCVRCFHVGSDTCTSMQEIS